MTKTNYKLIAKKRLANLEKEYEELKIKNNDEYYEDDYYICTIADLENLLESNGNYTVKRTYEDSSIVHYIDRNNFEVLDYYGKDNFSYSCNYLVRDINNKTGFVYKACNQVLNAKIDSENRKEIIENEKPLNIIGVAIEDINSADGVDISVTWQFLDFSKDIKYLYFTFAPYNCVGDPVKGRYDDGQKTGKITGPIYASFERKVSKWEAFWYNNTICSIKIVKVRVEYMDGSKYTYVNELDKISSPYLKYYSF